MAETMLSRLVALLRKAPDEIFIQPHNVPDPDAIASCFGMQRLLASQGVKAAVVYDHALEKANALKMLQVFGIEMVPAGEAATLGEEDWAVLVDCQKGNSNLTDLATQEVAVIDHHEYMGNKGYELEDIRPDVGACSTIVAQYFFENGVPLESNVATALLYGIFMDTDNLTRGVSELDIEMFYRLYSHSNLALINELKGSQISRADLNLYADAFHDVEIYGEIGFLRLASANDSLLGAAADMVGTIDGVKVVVAYSIRPAGVKLSTRSGVSRIKASELVRSVLKDVGFGGGHNAMAGGFLPEKNLPRDRSLDTFIRHRSIAFVEGAEGGERASP
jgi:nanoRNase/pAp phosphatase (c-di-AMP/oligoRNAs hydrolase)